ncbi:hypothetical protein V2G26_014416 [Clonostachys chloroleuca]
MSSKAEGGNTSIYRLPWRVVERTTPRNAGSPAADWLELLGLSYCHVLRRCYCRTALFDHPGHLEKRQSPNPPWLVMSEVTGWLGRSGIPRGSGKSCDLLGLLSAAGKEIWLKVAATFCPITAVPR